jgi:hypothetical protein
LLALSMCAPRAKRLRHPPFNAAPLVLADGKIEPAERHFLERLAMDLRLDRRTRDGLVQAMLVENAA